MCERCWRQYEKPRLKAEKLALRARREARRSPIEEAIEYVLEHKETTTMTRKLYTDEQKLEIGTLYADGLSYTQIKERTGANPQAVVSAARALGLPLRQPRHNGTEEPAPEAKVDLTLDIEDDDQDLPPLEEPSQDAPESRPEAILSLPVPEAAQDGWTVAYNVVTVVERSSTVYASSYLEAVNIVLQDEPGVGIADIVEVSKLRLPRL
jgi:hypothetical protein